MSQIRVQVLDRQAQRSEREVTTGTTAGELFRDDRDVVVARVNGELRDLSWAVCDGDVVEPVPADSPTGRSPTATRSSRSPPTRPRGAR